MIPAAVVQKKWKIRFRKQVHCPAERPALYQSVRGITRVRIRASQAHGVHRVGKKLRLKSVHRAHDVQAGIGGKQILCE